MQSVRVHPNLDPAVSSEDAFRNYRPYPNSGCSFTWEKVAIIGAVLGSGTMLSGFLAFAITAFPLVAVLVTGAVVLTISLVALGILSNNCCDPSDVRFEDDEDKIDAKYFEEAEAQRKDIVRDSDAILNTTESEPIAFYYPAPMSRSNTEISQNPISQTIETQQKVIDAAPAAIQKEEQQLKVVDRFEIIATFDAPKTAQPLELPVNISEPLQIPQLINYYDHCWELGSPTKLNTEKLVWEIGTPAKFNPEKMAKIYDTNRVVKVLESYIKQFSCDVDYVTNHGFIERRDIPKGSKVFVRADLHGDLKSLIENLKVLVHQGILDQNYKCKPDIQIVLLGDYVDRGDHCVKVLELMALLKMNNPNQVHFIRGNHESVSSNSAGGSQELKAFLVHGQLLETFYQTMPLTIYMGVNVDGKKKYKQFTHGTFELSMDPSPILDCVESYKTMIVPKVRKLSERILKLAVDVCPETIVNMKEKINFYQEKLDEKRKTLKALKDLGINELKIKQLELQISALRVCQLFATEQRTLDRLSSYNWGDINSYTRVSSRGTGMLELTPDDVEHYLRVSSDLHEVDALFRGHEHLFKIWEKDGKAFIHTLTIGMDANAYYVSDMENQSDRAYIMTADEVSWTKQALLRPAGSSVTAITAPVPLHSKVL